MKKRKKSDKQKAKEKAWKQFSRFIRLRDSDKKGIGKCCTCGQKQPWKALQAGHFPQGRGNPILFDERGCNAQCKGCNIMKHGALDEYAIFMTDKYGYQIIEELNQLKHTPLTYYESDFLEIAEKYKKLADIYERNKK